MGEIDEPRKAITALIVEKGAAGFAVDRREKKMGLNASSTAAISFGPACPAPTFSDSPETASRSCWNLSIGRAPVSRHTLGMARAAFADMVDYINTREQSGKRIIDFRVTSSSRTGSGTGHG